MALKQKTLVFTKLVQFQNLFFAANDEERVISKVYSIFGKFRLVLPAVELSALNNDSKIGAHFHSAKEKQSKSCLVFMYGSLFESILHV